MLLACVVLVVALRSRDARGPERSVPPTVEPAHREVATTELAAPRDFGAARAQPDEEAPRSSRPGTDVARPVPERRCVVTATLRLADTREILVDAYVALVFSSEGNQDVELARDRSDSSGQVRLEGPAEDDLYVHVEPNAALPVTGVRTSVPISLGDARDREIEVLVDPFPRYDFHGRVLDANDGRPVVGLAIAAHRPVVVPLATATDTEGRFVLHVTHPSHEGPLVVGPPAYGAFAMQLDRSHRDPARAALFLVSAGATLRGTVRKASGAPAVNAIVHLEAREGRPDEIAPASVPSIVRSTDDTGRFEFRSVAAGRRYGLRFSARPDGGRGADSSLVLAPGEVRDVDLVLPTERVVRGHVRGEDGTALVGARVTLHPVGADPFLSDVSDVSFDTDADGAFRFEAVAAGAYELSAVARHDAYDEEAVDRAARAHVRFDVLAGVEDLERDLVAYPSESIEGVLRDEEGGVELTAAFVHAGLVGGDDVRGTLVEPDGRFELRGLARGRYVLAAMARDRQETPEVVVASGARGVVLTLPARAVLTGRVVDETGRPFASDEACAESEVRALGADGSCVVFATNTDGRFACTPAPSGTRWVSVRRDERVSAWRRVEVSRRGESDVGTLVVERAAYVRLVGTASGDTWVEVRRGTDLAARARLSAGVETTLRVVPGELAVVVVGSGDARELERRVVAAGEAWGVRVP